MLPSRKISAESFLNEKLEPEFKIFYKDGRTGKKVDFGLILDGKPPVGVEVNFYTGTGSKPTEIKRSYAEKTICLKSFPKQRIKTWTLNYREFGRFAWLRNSDQTFYRRTDGRALA